MRQARWLLLAVCGAAAVPGCGEPTVTSNPALRDPNRTSRDSGGTDDIYDATQQAISNLVVAPRLKQQPGNRIVLNKIVNLTGIPGYDENIIYNKFLDGCLNAAGDKLIFLNRDSVRKERDLQLSGQVKTTGVDAAPAGADMTLDVELRQLQGGTSKTIQYTFRLTNLAGEIVWTRSVEIKKQA